MPSMYSSYHFNKGRGFILGHFIEDLVVYERKKSGNKEIIMGIQESNRGTLNTEMSHSIGIHAYI